MADVDWDKIPDYMCWNCGVVIGTHKENNDSGECYCIPCLWALIKSNSCSNNPFN